jgi:hypothetical protein
MPYSDEDKYMGMFLVHAFYKYWGIKVSIIRASTLLRDTQLDHVTKNWGINCYWLA